MVMFTIQPVLDAAQAVADAHAEDMAAVQGLLGRAQTRPAAVTIATGDTYTSIAAEHGVEVSQLRTWNGYADATLPVGEPMWLIDPATVPQTAEPPPDPDPVPDPTPPPLSPLRVSPLYGACPQTGGGITAVRDKYGPKASGRIFYQLQTELPAIPAGAPPAHLSWKPSGTVSDAQYRAILDRMRDDDVITFDHEEDNNKDGAGNLDNPTTIQAWRDQNNRLYDFVKAYKPGVLVAPVFTGGLMASYTADSRRKLWCTGLRGDLFGVDCDGVHITNSEPNYDRIDYRDEIDNCIRYMADPSNEGFVGITVAEYMTARMVPPDNSNGDMRASWFARRADYMASKKTADGLSLVYMILLFDTTNNGRPTNPLPNPSAELTMWKARVATNPTP